MSPDSTGAAITNAFAFQETLTVTAPQTTLTGPAARYDTNNDSTIDETEYQQTKTTG